MSLDRVQLFQSRRSGFGVCVLYGYGSKVNTNGVSVPAIGIWGLRLETLLSLDFDCAGFSPGDRDLGFASPGRGRL